MKDKISNILTSISEFILGISIIAILGGSGTILAGLGLEQLARIGAVPNYHSTFKKVERGGLAAVYLGLAGFLFVATEVVVRQESDPELFLKPISLKISSPIQRVEEKDLAALVVSEEENVVGLDAIPPSGSESFSEQKDVVEPEIATPIKLHPVLGAERPDFWSYYITREYGHPNQSGWYLKRFRYHTWISDEDANSPSKRLNGYELDRLALIFDVPKRSLNKLAGKNFASYESEGEKAIDEFLDLYWKYLRATETRTGDHKKLLLDSCKACKNLHGSDGIACGFHPYGWPDNNCPDKDEKLFLRRLWEKTEQLPLLSSGLSPSVGLIFIKDDRVCVHDKTIEFTYEFDFDGLPMSYNPHSPFETDAEYNLVSFVDYLKSKCS